MPSATGGHPVVRRMPFPGLVYRSITVGQQGGAHLHHVVGEPQPTEPGDNSSASPETPIENANGKMEAGVSAVFHFVLLRRF
jgi:hypothetical protein